MKMPLAHERAPDAHMLPCARAWHIAHVRIMNHAFPSFSGKNLPTTTVFRWKLHLDSNLGTSLTPCEVVPSEWRLARGRSSYLETPNICLVKHSDIALFLQSAKKKCSCSMLNFFYCIFILLVLNTNIFIFFKKRKIFSNFTFFQVIPDIELIAATSTRPLKAVESAVRWDNTTFSLPVPRRLAGL